MRYLSSDYVFPVSSPPVKNGIIVTDDDGFILGLLKTPAGIRKKDIEYFKGILCPGFINAHCHLELSYLKGKIPEKSGLPGFIAKIESIRGNFSGKKIQKAISETETEMMNYGIAGVGDISNSDFSFRQKSSGRIKYHTFIEALGFHPDRADSAFEKCIKLFEQTAILHLPASITPHAPYSASKKLLKKIFAFALKNNSVLSIHNQENADENKMFREGKGKILEQLNLLGIDTSGWKPSGKNSIESIFEDFPKSNKILLVHNTFTSKNDLTFLKKTIPSIFQQAYFCFCPNANLYIENCLPDFKLFINEKCKITVGTDSLASNHSLSILEELKTISLYAPRIPLQMLLTWATKNGAEFFGWEKELGTFEKGKKPGINWIKNIYLPTEAPRLENLKLTSESEVQRIF